MRDKQPLILVANPGSASRKYGLFFGGKEIASLHFEFVRNKIQCNAGVDGESFSEPAGVSNIDDVITLVEPMLLRTGALRPNDTIDGVGLRIVAPSGYFLENHQVDEEVLRRLNELKLVAPLHIDIIHRELTLLRKYFGNIPVYGVSDSAFHITKPEYAWNYALPLADTDKYEIKRYGYHGLSMQSTVRQLRRHDRLANKIVVAHLGSGASVTALHGGKSLDNTMGYSPLEGLVMSTRSGTIDYSAVHALRLRLGLSEKEMDEYLYNKAGLLGLGGSSDIRELVERENQDNHQAALALSTYVYSVQKGIAQMVAALGDVDALVFTGTVGERSFIMRNRIVQRLHYLDFYMDHNKNNATDEVQNMETISELGKSKPIYVVHVDEASEIARQVAEMIIR